MAEYLAAFPSAARTVDGEANFVNDEGAVGAVIVIDVTAATSSPSVVFTVQGYDPASNKAYTILASVAITGTGTTVLRVHPDLTASANTIAKDMMPRHCRILADHSNTDSITYSVGVSLV